MIKWGKLFRRQPKSPPSFPNHEQEILYLRRRETSNLSAIKVMSGILVEFDRLVAARMPEAHARMMTSERFKRRRVWWQGRAHIHVDRPKYRKGWKLWGPQEDGLDKRETRLGVSPILAEMEAEGDNPSDGG